MLLQRELEAARELRDQVPEESRCLMLPAVHAELWLEYFAGHQYNVFTPASLTADPVSPLSYQLRLKWAMLRGRY